MVHPLSGSPPTYSPPIWFTPTNALIIFFISFYFRMSYDRSRSSRRWFCFMFQESRLTLKDWVFKLSDATRVARREIPSEAGYLAKLISEAVPCKFVWMYGCSDVGMYGCMYPNFVWPCLSKLEVAERCGFRHYKDRFMLQKSYISNFEKIKVPPHYMQKTVKLLWAFISEPNMVEGCGLWYFVGNCSLYQM